MDDKEKRPYQNSRQICEQSMLLGVVLSMLLLAACAATDSDAPAVSPTFVSITATSTISPASTATREILSSATPNPSNLSPPAIPLDEPTATYTATPVVPTATPPSETPFVQAPYLQFDSWSPDGRFFAFWVSDAADMEAWQPYAMPGGVLTFYTVATGEMCAVDVIHTIQSDAADLFWQADGSVVVQYEGSTFSGMPCGEFVPIEDFVPPAATAVDPALSPDRQHRVSTQPIDGPGGMLNYETVLYDGDRELYRFAWRIEQRLGGYVDWLGGEWVSPTQFVIYETADNGPILLDAEKGIVPVLSELFGLDIIPTQEKDDFTLAVRPLPGDQPDAYHLFLHGVGSTTGFPPIMIYHAESEAVEELPTYSLWSPTVIDEWFLLRESNFDTGYERSNLLRRRLEDVGGTWEKFAENVDSILWDDASSQIVWIQEENTAVWQTWPEGELIGRYRTAPFWAGPVAFSPDGQHVVLVGNHIYQQDYGLFLLSR